MIIGITSLARAGKDTVAKILSENYGFIKLNMSDQLVEEASRRGIEPTKMNLSILGDKLRKELGRDIIMRLTLKEAENHDRVVITGIRSPEEITLLKQEGDFSLIFIDAPLHIRFSRRKSNDPKSLDDFQLRDKRDIENKGLDEVIRQADIIINNSGSLKELKEKIKIISYKL